jgi:hypothetical protein
VTTRRRYAVLLPKIASSRIENINERNVMAVVVHILLKDVTKDQYDTVRAIVGWLDTPPTGGISHVTWWEGADCHNLDVWESEQAFTEFGEKRLGPGMAEAGVVAEPQATLHPAHEAFAPDAVRIVS